MSSFIFTEKRYKKEKVYSKPKEFRLHINWKEHPAKRKTQQKRLEAFKERQTRRLYELLKSR